MLLNIDLQMWIHEILKSDIPEQPSGTPCRAESQIGFKVDLIQFMKELRI